MSLARKVKTALDENRLLILGTQVLFGFQLNVVFADLFPTLPPLARSVDCVALMMMTLAIVLLIAPSMQHRIVEGGTDTNRILRVAGLFADAALLPFGLGLGLDLYIVLGPLLGSLLAAVTGAVFCGLAGLLWYALGYFLRLKLGIEPMIEKEGPTPLPARIDQMLTEARIIVPGAQALLGFQLAVTFTRAFNELDETPKLVHVGALCCVALAVILLMTPAALHRIGFRGEDTNSFLAIGSAFVLAAPAALGLGLAGDIEVAVGKATGSPMLAIALAVAALLVVIVFWYAVPLVLRITGRRRSR